MTAFLNLTSVPRLSMAIVNVVTYIRHRSVLHIDTVSAKHTNKSKTTRY